ncbi:MAG TPA: carboxypeptidase-like regulatory domain-containing protein [Acidobacteriaceae bacterium]|nr:carboxypeptidase-like regulatory domain-containing protein [Acidobacteriaceae bacterium]
MSRRPTICVPLLIALAVLCADAPRASAQGNSLSGVIRDSRGAPQPGVAVELLRPDLSVVSEVFADAHGRYRIEGILPGIYEIKASGAMFLPTLRENLQVLTGTKLVVNLTLNTLYEAFRWLPAKPRQADEPKDDWTWTLRLSANRPLLRLLEDGPLVVVSNGDGSAPELKARVTVRGGESGFGDGGLHNDFELERTPEDGRAMIFRADLSHGSPGQLIDPALNAMVGYEQQLALGRTFRAVGAVETRPDIAGGPLGQGLQAIELRSGQTMNFGPGVQAEFGNEMQGIRLGDTILANHPFAAVTVHRGAAYVGYRMSTAPGIQTVEDLDREATVEPRLGERNGRLTLEQGLHQELVAGKGEGDTRVKMAVWHEQVKNPVVTGGGNISAADWAGGNLLYDETSDLLRATGQSYSGEGMLTEVEQRVNGSTWISFEVALGDALAMADAASGTDSLDEALNGMKARETPMVGAGIRGKVAATGTQWRASYRWQNPRTLTAVDAFSSGASSPYLSFLVRQPIRYRRMIPNGVEALVDVRNLLAEGYRPFVSSDGSVLYFAEAARCVQGGLSFTF